MLWLKIKHINFVEWLEVRDASPGLVCPLVVNLFSLKFRSKKTL
jgi:hypothetical protein